MNYFGILFVASARRSLTAKLHAAYLDPRGQSYYVLNNLDKKAVGPDARITNDVDLMLQFALACGGD